MEIELELKGAIANAEVLIGRIEKAESGAIDLPPAKDAVARARTALEVKDVSAMQCAWVEVTFAEASLHAQLYGWYKLNGKATGIGAANVKGVMDGFLASTQAALRQLLANKALLGSIPDIQLPDAAAISLAEATGKDAAKFIDSAAAWIFRNQDKMIAAAKTKADAKASASANSASGRSQMRKL